MGRGYQLIGDEVFGADVGNVGVAVHSWVAFASTNLDSAYWAPTPDISSMFGSLFVRFLSFAVYRYDAVDWATFRDLLISPSHGQFFANVIKPRWVGIRIQGPLRKVTPEIIEAHSGRSIV
jgi:hypothetical protein